MYKGKPDHRHPKEDEEKADEGKAKKEWKEEHEMGSGGSDAPSGGTVFDPFAVDLCSFHSLRERPAPLPGPQRRSLRYMAAPVLKRPADAADLEAADRAAKRAKRAKLDAAKADLDVTRRRRTSRRG